MYAFESTTGNVQWKLDVKKGIPGKIILTESKLYAMDFDESLLVIDSRTGKLVHKIEGTTSKDKNEFRFPSSPAIHNQHLFYAIYSGRVRAINLMNHKVLWDRSLPSEVTSDIGFNGTNLYIATEDKSIYELDPKNGAILRKIETNGVAQWKLIATEDELMFLQWNEKISVGLKAINIKTGKEIWNRNPPTGSKWDTFRPLIWKEVIIVGSDQGELVAYDYRTGVQAWSITLDGDLRSIGASDFMVYAGATNGSLFAIIPPNP